MMRLAFALGGLCVLSLLYSPSQAATLEDSARAESEVVLYSSLNNEQIVTLVEAFRKKYPFIKPSFYRGTSERVLQRAFTEAKAGRFAVDVVTSAGFQVQLMKDSGLTQRFVPPEATAYEEGFKDPDGHWVNVHSLLNSMAYNTHLVRPNEAPKRYEDLLAPRWKGRLGVNLQDPEWYVSLQRRWGKDKARNFLKALAAQQPGIRDRAQHHSAAFGSGRISRRHQYLRAHRRAHQEPRGSGAVRVR